MRQLSLTFMLLCVVAFSIHASDTIRAGVHLSRALALLDSARFDLVPAEAQRAFSIFQKQKPADSLALADCQNATGRAWLGMGKPDKAIVHFQKALSLRRHKLGEQHPSVANCYNNLGIAWSEKGDRKQALVFHQKALVIRLATLGECHSEVATSYHNTGNCLYLIGNYRQAIENHHRALHIRLDAFGQKHRLVAQSCTAIAHCLMQQGSTRQAILFFEKALAAEEDFFGKNARRAAETFTALGGLELDRGNFTKARQHLLAALKINSEQPAAVFDKLGLSWQQEGKYDLAQQYHENALRLQLEAGRADESLTGSIYANLGACLLQNKQPEEARKNFQLAQVIFDKMYGRQHPAAGQCLMNTGICFFEKGEPGKALNYFEQATAIFKQNETYARQLLADCHHHTGQVWQQRGDAAGALAFFEKALQIQGFQAGEPVTSENAGKLLPVLAARAGALLQLARTSCCASALNDCGDAFDLALHALAVQQAALNDERAEQLATGQYYHVFEGAIETNFLLWEKTGEKSRLEKAFRLSERSRYLAKMEAPISVAGLQNGLLEERQALLEWFVGKDLIFTFLLTKDTLIGFTQKHDFPLIAWVSAVRRGIYYQFNQGAETAAERRQEYLKHAGLLFQKLLQLPLNALPDDVTRLTLIPDGALHYLPFDALTTESPAPGTPFNSWPYLLKKYAVSYGISAAQLLRLKNTAALRACHSLLAVAPKFEKDSRGLQALRHNRKEAASAVGIWGGLLLDGQNATLPRFLEAAPGYAILHLSTHGNADAEYGETSWLAFTEIPDTLENESLLADSLRHLHLPAELVVLSACETGIGEYRPGGGTAGLASAFFEAGARSLLTTLWAVEDAATAEMTVAFLRHLKSGMPKDLALQKARQDYLNSYPDGYGHPYYWAAFAMTGEVEAISTAGKDELRWMFWLAPVVVLGLLYFILQAVGFWPLAVGWCQWPKANS